jgi:16S rRNA (guanine1516-N2)-methyltransferase
MCDEHPSTTVCVEALEPAFTLEAAAWAARLHLPLDGAADFALQLGSQGLQFVEHGPHAAGPVQVDFIRGAVAHRRLFGGGNGQMIAKAVGIQPGIRPFIVDATAGLGRDAFVLARLGCRLILIERHPLIAALLEDGLQRANADAEIGAIVAQMRLLCGNAITLLGAWADEPPQVIYLDPMFPQRDKSAQVKKEMRLFRPLAGDDDDAPALLAAALALATHRVVVKRPRKAAAITGEKPGYTLEGKSSRFDIYPKKSLKAKATAAPCF